MNIISLECRLNPALVKRFFLHPKCRMCQQLNKLSDHIVESKIWEPPFMSLFICAVKIRSTYFCEVVLLFPISHLPGWNTEIADILPVIFVSVSPPSPLPAAVFVLWFRWRCCRGSRLVISTSPCCYHWSSAHTQLSLMSWSPRYRGLNHSVCLGWGP